MQQKKNPAEDYVLAEEMGSSDRKKHQHEPTGIGEFTLRVLACFFFDH